MGISFLLQIIMMILMMGMMVGLVQSFYQMFISKVVKKKVLFKIVILQHHSTPLSLSNRRTLKCTTQARNLLKQVRSSHFRAF